MFALPHSVRVYLASAPVDMRCGHDGLFAIVSAWGLDPYSGDLYAFVGRRRDRVKILVWHRGGFVLLYKRLEKGRFRIPRVPAGAEHAAIERDGELAKGSFCMPCDSSFVTTSAPTFGLAVMSTQAPSASGTRSKPRTVVEPPALTSAWWGEVEARSRAAARREAR